MHFPFDTQLDEGLLVGNLFQVTFRERLIEARARFLSILYSESEHDEYAYGAKNCSQGVPHKSNSVKLGCKLAD